MDNKMKRVALIVEDDPDLHQAMSAQLESMHFEVIGAFHYAAAVALLAATKPTLVCIDLELPTQSGYELCEYIRGPLALSRVPILVTSDSFFPKHMAQAEEAGANAFLRKPFSMGHLSNYIDALMSRVVHQSEPFMRRLQL